MKNHLRNLCGVSGNGTKREIKDDLFTFSSGSLLDHLREGFDFLPYPTIPEHDDKINEVIDDEKSAFGKSDRAIGQNGDEACDGYDVDNAVSEKWPPVQFDRLRDDRID